MCREDIALAKLAAMKWRRAIAVWTLIVVVESIHGTVRQLLLAPAIGDRAARQIGVGVGSLLILLIAWLTAHWLGPGSARQRLGIGLLWVVLTVLFKFALGSALGYTRAQMLADYDRISGGLMGSGLAFMLLAPTLGAALARRSSSRWHD
jgi:hypothetical protein